MQDWYIYTGFMYNIWNGWTEVDERTHTYRNSEVIIMYVWDDSSHFHEQPVWMSCSDSLQTNTQSEEQIKAQCKVENSKHKQRALIVS